MTRNCQGTLFLVPTPPTQRALPLQWFPDILRGLEFFGLYWSTEPKNGGLNN
jgi:hypothetical protein